MSLDPLMEKWIRASVSLHFDGGKGPYKLFIEGDEIEVATESIWTELRITGPRFVTQPGGHYKVELDVNLACTMKMGDDQYALDKMVGLFRARADQLINVNKYGDTDPAEYVGCFLLRNDEAVPLDVIPWGQMTLPGPIRVMNTSIDAYYVMEL